MNEEPGPGRWRGIDHARPASRARQASREALLPLTLADALAPLLRRRRPALAAPRTREGTPR